MPILDIDLPAFWPRINDRLFVQSQHSIDAQIATFQGERLYRMKNGYKSAADRLVSHTEDKAYERHNLVWPIIFCYRQYIELALKDQIAEHGLRIAPEIKPNWKNHSLQTLWALYKKLIGEALSEIDTSELEEICAMDAYIAEFDHFDLGSYTFRYPTDTKGNQTEMPLSSIDLFHLRNAMEGIFNFFDASESMLTEFLNNRRGEVS